MAHASQTSPVGILGGGQLAMMLGEAAQRLNMPTSILERNSASPAHAAHFPVTIGDWRNPSDLKTWLASLSIVTFENEFVDTGALREAAHSNLQFFPSLDAIDLIQDKLYQKEFLKNAGLPVPRFRSVSTMADCEACADDWGWPLVLKERRMGYDGKGTFVLRGPDALDGFWSHYHAGRDLMAEEFIPFATELAIQVARGKDGSVAHFPVVETFQSNSICLWAKCPALIPRNDATAIKQMASTVINQLNAVGVFAVELFYTASGEIFIYELAPRVHNSGHYTIEGCKTSQFEQHIRAVSGLALGETSLTYPGVAMLNILGEFDGQCDIQSPSSLANGHAALHWYHKQDSRRGRKLGHITAWGDTANAALATAIEARKEIELCPKK